MLSILTKRINWQFLRVIPNGTLGGLIAHFYKEVPQKEDEITIDNYHFAIE
jgi:Mg2+/Co2+ transporter CorB